MTDPEQLQQIVERLLANTATETEGQALLHAFRSGHAKVISLSSGERAVSIGGAVSSSNIVTGNNNLILQLPGEDGTLQAALRQFLSGSPALSTHSVPFQAPPLPTHYVARPEVMEPIKKHLLMPGSAISGILVITAVQAMGGIGKSTLVAALAHEVDVQTHFPDGVLWATLGQNPDLSSILSDWIRALGDYQTPQFTDVKSGIKHLRSLLSHKSVLLVIDDAWEASHAEALLAGGQQCRALITTRRLSVADGINAKTYALSVMTPDESLHLFAARLGRDVEDTEIQEALALARLVGYLPLALELAAVRVARGGSWTVLTNHISQEVARLEALGGGRFLAKGEVGLEASFLLSLHALRADSEEAWEGFIHLGVLPEDVVIVAPMAATIWGLAEEDASALLERLWDDSMLTIGSSLLIGGQYYRGYRLHDLWHDMARRLLGAEVPAGLGVSASQAHKKLLDSYWQRFLGDRLTSIGWDALPYDGYIHDHLLWHMEKAHQFEEIVSLLRSETPEGWNAWYVARERLGQTANYIQDLNFALKLTMARSQESLSAGKTAETLSVEILLVLMLASLNSLARNIPAQVVGVFVQYGVWSAAQGLAYARRRAVDDAQAIAIVSVAPYLSTPDKREALEEALVAAKAVTTDAERHRALVQVAIGFAQAGQPQQALATIQGIKDDALRSRAMAQVAVKLAEAGQIQQALRVAQSIQNEFHCATSLAGVASNMAEGQRASILEQALKTAQSVRKGSNRFEAITQVVVGLAKNGQIQEAIAAIETIEVTYSRAQALVAIASLLPQPQRKQMLEQALKLTEGIEDIVTRSHALVQASVELAKAGQIQEAIAAIEAIEDAYSRAQALVGVASHLQEPRRDQMLEQALTLVLKAPIQTRAFFTVVKGLATNGKIEQAIKAVNSGGSSASRITAMILIAVTLAEDGQMEAALKIPRTMKNSRYRNRVLAPIAIGFAQAGQPQQALATIQGIKDDALRSRAMAQVAVKLAEAGQIQQALEVSHGVTVVSQQNWVMGEIALNLAKVGQIQEAIAAIETIEVTYSRAQALVAIASLLPQPQRKQMLEQALKLTEGKDVVTRSHALVQASVELAKAGQIQEAIAAIEAIEDAYSHAQALVAIASHLPQPQRNLILEQALTHAGAIQRASARARSLAEIAGRMTEPRRGQILKQALEFVQEIKDDKAHSRALVQVSVELCQWR